MQPELRASQRSRLCVGILLLLCGLSFFWRLGANGIWDLDEALYTESGREMRLSGDYVTPRVNGHPFFEKPPLIYWESAAAFTLFGESELTARLPSAIAATITAFLIFLTGARFFGRFIGASASALFILSPLAFGTGRQLTTDATLNLCITGALLALFHCISGSRQAESEPMGASSETCEQNSRKRIVLALAFWSCCGLGVLAKGLPGILVPSIVGAIYVWAISRGSRVVAWQAIRRIYPLTGILVFLAIAVPWHLLAWRQSGSDFVQEYVITQHLARFRGGDTAHKAPIWFFVPGFLAGFFPLALFVPAAILDRRNRVRASTTESTEFQQISADSRENNGRGQSSHDDSDERANRLRSLLKIWAVAVFVMFSLSGSKLISYILPMYPPAALLAADWAVRAGENTRGRRSLSRCLVFGFVIVAGLLTILVLRGPVIQSVESATGRPIPLNDVPAGAFEWAVHLFAILAASTGAATILVRVGNSRRAFVALGAGMSLFIAVAVAEGLPLINKSVVAPLQHMASIAGLGAQRSGTNLAIYVGPPRRPSALFYLPDKLVCPSEDSSTIPSRVLELTDPGDSYQAIDNFLNRNRSAVVLTESNREARLRESQRMRMIAREGRFVVLVR